MVKNISQEFFNLEADICWPKRIASRIDVPHTDSPKPHGSFFVRGLELRKRYVGRESHYYALYAVENKNQLPNVLRQVLSALPWFSLFIGRDYLQDRTEKYLGYLIMPYHVNLMPATIPALDKICYSYNDSFAISTEVAVAGTENGSEEAAVMTSPIDYIHVVESLYTWPEFFSWHMYLRTHSFSSPLYITHLISMVSRTGKPNLT